MNLGLNLSLMWRGGELIISVTIASDASGTLGTATPPAGFIFAQSAIVITIAAAGAGTEQTVDATLYPDGEIVEDTPGEFAADLILAGQVGDYTIRITGVELVPLAVTATIAGDASNPLVTLTPPTGSTWTSDTATTANGIAVSVDTSGVLTEDSAGTWATAYYLLLAGETAIDSFSADVTTNGTTFTSPVTLTVTGALNFAANFDFGPLADNGLAVGSHAVGASFTADAGVLGTVDYEVGETGVSIVSMGGAYYSLTATGANYEVGRIEDAFPLGTGNLIFRAYVSGTDFIVTAYDSTSGSVTATVDMSGLESVEYYRFGASVDSDGSTLRAVVQDGKGGEATATADISGINLATPACSALLGSALVNSDEITTFDTSNGVGFVASVYFEGNGTGNMLCFDSSTSSELRGPGFLKQDIGSTANLVSLMDARLPIWQIDALSESVFHMSPVLMFDPANTRTMLDSAGTAIADNGDNISFIFDLSGNGRNAVQSSAAAQPARVDGSGIVIADFATTTDRMDATISPSFSGPTVYACIAVDPDRAANYERILSFGNTGQADFNSSTKVALLLRDQSTDDYGIYRNNALRASDAISASGTASVIEVMISASGHKISVNGGTDTGDATNLGSISADTLSIMSQTDNNSQDRASGDFFALVLFDRIPSSSERTDIRAWATDRAGI